MNKVKQGKNQTGPILNYSAYLTIISIINYMFRLLRVSQGSQAALRHPEHVEGFFGTLKSEFYHLNRFRGIDELKSGVTNYIRHYNHDHIKLKLGGLSPVQYRTQLAKA